MPMRHTFCVVSRVFDILLESNSLNNYAISTDELARGLQKSGSTLSLLGNTIDQSAALITAGKLYCLKNIEIYFYRTYLIALIA